MQGIAVNEMAADRVITTYEGVLEKEGEFSLEDAVEIEMSIDRKYKNDE